MSNCPVCNAPVSADFGLTECDKCGAQLLVHADGSVEYSGSESPSPVDSDPIDATEMVAPAEPEPVFDFASQDEDAPQEFSDPEEIDPPVNDALFEEEPAEFVGEVSAAPEDEPEEAQAPPEEAPAVYKPPGTSDSPDLSDIAKFGNSDSLSRDGSLRYNVWVTGIDTADVRGAFREAITDRKFMWDIDQILRSIKNGEVQITNISAVKAYILVSRLRNLPVRVKWEQYAVHQA